MAIDFDEVVQFYEDGTIKDLSEALVAINNRIEEMEQELSDTKAEREILRKEVIPNKMNEVGIQTATFPGLGRLSLRNDAYVSTKKGKKYDLINWLTEQGYGGMMEPTVNSSTLKAFIKEQDGLGNPIPSEDIVSYTPYQYVSITKER